MRVGVTGGTGFLGRALVRRLLAEKIPTRVLARPSQRAAQLEALGAEIVRGDLADAESLERFARETDLVYHVAAMVDSPGSKSDFIETNVGGTERIFSACLDRHVSRVIYLSSLAVYGLARNGKDIDEDSPYDDEPETRDFYSQSKILADEFAVAFARKNNLPTTIIRPGIVFGTGKHLPVSLLGFHSGKTNFVFGARDSRLPLNYIENLIDAMRQVSNPGDDSFHQFNILDDDDLTLEQYHTTKSQVEKARALYFPGWPVLLAARFTDAMKRMLPVDSSAGLTGHQVKRALQNRRYDTRRFRQQTGWRPNVPLEEAIRRSLLPPL